MKKKLLLLLLIMLSFSLGGLSVFTSNKLSDNGSVLGLKEQSQLDTQAEHENRVRLHTSFGVIRGRQFAEGATIEFRGRYNDTSRGDGEKHWVAVVDYGDGQIVELGQFVEDDRDLVINNHIYFVEANRTVAPILRVARYVDGIKDAEVEKTLSLELINILPTASVTPTTFEVVEGTPVQLDASQAPGNLPLTGQWSGSCTGEGLTTNAPTTVGTHTCTYTVTDVDGDSAVATATINVTPAAIVPADDDTGTTPPPTTNETDPVVPAPEAITDPVVVNQEDNGLVLGTEKCTEKSTVSGQVYSLNNFNVKDGYEGALINVLVSQDGKYISEGSVETDHEGNWSYNACEGSYKFELVNDGNFNYVTEEEKLVEIKPGSALSGVDFEIQLNGALQISSNTDSSTVCKTQWYYWLPTLLALLILLFALLTNRLKRKYRNQSNQTAF